VRRGVVRGRRQESAGLEGGAHRRGHPEASVAEGGVVTRAPTGWRSVDLSRVDDTKLTHVIWVGMFDELDRWRG